MRLEAFIVQRAFALKFLTLFKFSFVGYLQNFDNACLRRFMASLQSSLYHGLLFVGFVEVFGIILLEISRREEVKSSRGSKELLNLFILRLQRIMSDTIPNLLYLVSTLRCDRSWNYLRFQ